MTKERKIAIKIWEELKAFILSSPQNVTGNSFVVKKHYLISKYGMHWDCHCWFCQYVRYKRVTRDDDGYIVDEGCDKCPLHKLAHAAPGDCGCHSSLMQSPYARLINDYAENTVKAEACDIIIKALKGEEQT